jgi:hypothetical protein
VLDAAGAAEGFFNAGDLGTLDVLHATARGLAAALIDTGPDGHLLATAHGTRMFPRLAPSGADEMEIHE